MIFIHLSGKIYTFTLGFCTILSVDILNHSDSLCMLGSLPVLDSMWMNVHKLGCEKVTWMS